MEPLKFVVVMVVATVIFAFALTVMMGRGSSDCPSGVHGTVTHKEVQRT